MHRPPASQTCARCTPNSRTSSGPRTASPSSASPSATTASSRRHWTRSKAPLRMSSPSWPHLMMASCTSSCCAFAQTPACRTSCAASAMIAPRARRKALIGPSGGPLGSSPSFRRALRTRLSTRMHARSFACACQRAGSGSPCRSAKPPLPSSWACPLALPSPPRSPSCVTRCARRTSRPPVCIVSTTLPGTSSSQQAPSPLRTPPGPRRRPLPRDPREATVMATPMLIPSPSSSRSSITWSQIRQPSTSLTQHTHSVSPNSARSHISSTR
mmetsp:Transcript_33142/g.81371  ORF Transcript_33142/g.81371 Transcript_33142/m.81371 type:complete len:271 (-) Transcript_33142:3012-3824(-)